MTNTKNAFILAGTASHVGKTTVTAAVLQCFVEMDLKVQAMKCGPDYLDPTFHRFVTQRPSINIDLHLMGEDALKESFVRHASRADVVVIEGVMGLYDGWDHSLDNGSAAHLSRLLGVPIVLVVDGSGSSTSIAALVNGYRNFDPRVAFAGLILNQVGSEGHARLLAEALERYSDVPVVGYIQRQPGFSLESRHLGLKPAHEVADLSDQLKALAAGAKQSLNLMALRSIHVQMPLVDVTCLGDLNPPEQAASVQGDYRVAYALDDAFYFYYQDNLDAMARAGMTLIPFSPLKDKALPAGTEAIYLGGGYPELYAKPLSENLEMLRAIGLASSQGMPIYGECGGMMYLCEALEDMEGTAYPMVGALKGQVHMTKTLQRFGYVDVVVESGGLFPRGARLKGHEFHRSTVHWEEAQALAYSVYKSFNFTDTLKAWQCGAQQVNTLGAYAHVHFASAKEVLDHWVQLMAKRRQEKM